MSNQDLFCRMAGYNSVVTHDTVCRGDSILHFVADNGIAVRIHHLHDTTGVAGCRSVFRSPVLAAVL